MKRFIQYGVLLGTLAFAAGCSDTTDVCAGSSIIGIMLTVNTPTGTDITGTTWVVLTRLEGSPPVTVDSAAGLGNQAMVRTWDTPGTYHLVIQHDGFETQERIVTVPASPRICESVITQKPIVVLTPIS